jgi:SPP1 gp7 family putative phage head morphogenesis protein
MIRLSAADWVRLKNSAKAAQDLENKWDRRIADAIDASLKKIEVPSKTPIPDFETLFIEHWFETQVVGFKIADNESELDSKAPRLARRLKSLADILKLYDLWRKGRYRPKAAIKSAKDMKKRYIDAVQKAWKKHSEDFREGGEQTQAEIRKEVRKAAETTKSRAATIVRTETTRYYNQARKDYYDASEDVTHYLFMAVRDKATTPWCTASTVNGKRGRHGLVYAKDDPLLKTETPPIHWNCRSELLPLNRFNPSHKKLINDYSFHRRTHQCTPLPPGWSK